MIEEGIPIQRIRIVTLAVLAFTLLMPNSTYADQVIRKAIHVNDSPIQATIIIRNNYQMVPAIWFRNVSKKVSWSERYRSAVISSQQTIIGFPEGERFADYDLHGLNRWERDELHTTSFIHEGRMYVPLAYTARKLGMLVTYDAHSQSTSIHNATISTSTTNSGNSGNFAYATNSTASASRHSISSDDLHWLNQITEAEAGGESYRGKLAVAASILNRVGSPDWPNSIQETIFQVDTFNGVSYYQFSPVLDNRIYNVTPSKDTLKAVQAALRGEDASKGAVVFYNPEKTDNKWVRGREVTVTIGSHIFAK